MRVAGQNKQQKIRRKASEALLAYDLHTGLPIGQIMDLSIKGMKLMSEEPVILYKVYYCRIVLGKKIKGCDDVLIDAECRWCKRNEETSWYDSGYMLRFPTPKDADIVREMTRAWMVDHAEKLNPHSKKPPKKKRRFL